MRLVSVAAVAVVACASLAVGCKGKTITQDNPQTKADLDACIAAKGEKEKLVQSLEAEKVKCEMKGSGAAGEIMVSIEGNALTVKPAKPGEPRPINDQAAGEASKQFLDLVAKSRGGIQKCYEQALKKDSTLQARTVTLTVSASFSAAGAYRSASFSPSLSSGFDACMQALASKWALPVDSPAMTFKAQVSLTPS